MSASARTRTRRPRAAHITAALLLALALGLGVAPAGTAGTAAAVPGMGRRAVEYGLRTDRGLAAQDRSLLMAWLNGDPLLDPRLVAWVDAATLGYPVEGAGAMARGAAGCHGE